MGLSQIIAGISALVTGLVPLSCQHKTPPSKNPVPPPAAIVTVTNAATAAVVPTNSVIHDLGEISLTNHYERCVQLGGGKECILYPNLLDKHRAEITVTFESKTPAGQIHDMIVSQINAKTGEAVEVMLGDFQLNLKPDIASE